ncbi:MAG: hypothetical protein LBU61_05460 [Coriobacteriales bacterium]|nr:hypothetical protein [Coriobacteriales bacterium]
MADKASQVKIWARLLFVTAAIQIAIAVANFALVFSGYDVVYDLSAPLGFVINVLFRYTYYLLLVLAMAMLGIYGLRVNRTGSSNAPSPWSKIQAYTDLFFSLNSGLGMVTSIAHLVLVYKTGFVQSDFFMPVMTLVRYILLFGSVCQLVVQVIALVDARRVKTTAFIQGVVLACLLCLIIISNPLFESITNYVIRQINNPDMIMIVYGFSSMVSSLLPGAMLVVRATWALAVNRQIANASL